MWFLNRSDTNRVVQAQMNARDDRLEILDLESRGINCTIRVAKTKTLISFAVTVAKLICAFVFAYADCWFSHEVAHIEIFLQTKH